LSSEEEEFSGAFKGEASVTRPPTNETYVCTALALAIT
jgi:hypothetical protein